MNDELFAFDPEIVEQRAAVIAGRIIHDMHPELEYRAVLAETSSPAFAAMVAERAVAIATRHVLSEEVFVAMVPMYGRRIAGFLHQVRLLLGRFQAAQDAR